MVVIVHGNGPESEDKIQSSTQAQDDEFHAMSTQKSPCGETEVEIDAIAPHKPPCSDKVHRVTWAKEDEEIIDESACDIDPMVAEHAKLEQMLEDALLELRQIKEDKLHLGNTLQSVLKEMSVLTAERSLMDELVVQIKKETSDKGAKLEIALLELEELKAQKEKDAQSLEVTTTSTIIPTCPPSPQLLEITTSSTIIPTTSLPSLEITTTNTPLPITPPPTPSSTIVATNTATTTTAALTVAVAASNGAAAAGASLVKQSGEIIGVQEGDPELPVEHREDESYTLSTPRRRRSVLKNLMGFVSMKN